MFEARFESHFMGRNLTKFENPCLNLSIDILDNEKRRDYKQREEQQLPWFESRRTIVKQTIL
jgi:hypothetical protein